MAKYDLDKDGFATKAEAITVIKENPASFVGMCIKAWKNKNWSEIIFILLIFLGFHSLKLHKKIKEYGTQGYLGWLFKITRFFGKDADPPSTASAGGRKKKKST